MKSKAFLIVLFLGARMVAPAADSRPLRLAIGPFFAPVANDELVQASKLLPDLITVELSKEPRFQLVEREKVQAVCHELNLSASGLVTGGSVAKLGQLLACDWLISGSIVQPGVRTHVWTRIIDIRTGVMLDLDDSAYGSGDCTVIVPQIAAFVARARTAGKPRQFIAMGPFADMNPSLSPTREDWARRIPPFLEKYFHDAGFGLTELAAVNSIFEEQHLSGSGLMEQSNAPIRLQAAFWLVDGGCEWAEKPAGNLDVGLRVQRVGGPEQMFRLSFAPGEEVEKSVAETIAKALMNTNQAAPELLAKAEADLLAARGMELATRRSPFRQRRFTAGSNQLDRLRLSTEFTKRIGENRSAALATYERTLLLDPKNLEAKSMLGYALLFDEDSGRRERGKELLREVAASQDPKYADRAQRHLNEADTIARRLTDPARRPIPNTDLAGLQKAVAVDPANLKAKYELGLLLMVSDSGSDRGRGARLLQEVAAGDSQELAELARKNIPDWAKFLKPLPPGNQNIQQ